MGGAVRDKMLNFPVRERDWLVVGATPQQMLDLGYRQVGKDFPVFLHPTTQEEYALARTERKTGKGYTGFSCYSSPDVTLEQDLARRDLTINAMAQSSAGQLIDPYGGQDDLDKRILRHVSPAFSEDPLRILRVARFAARYAHLGFRVADETLTLMQQIVASGELEHLVAERIWKEIESALSELDPGEFIQVLMNCNALKVILPEVDRLFGVPQPEKYHPEIDTGLHTLLALKQAVELSDSTLMRYAVLVHDLGKGVTPKDQWPSHIAHETKGIKLVRNVGNRFKIPKNYTELSILVSRFHTHCHRALEMRPVKIVNLLTQVDALRRPERFELFLLASEADARGRKGLEHQPYPQADFLRRALVCTQSIDPQAFVELGLKGKALGEKLTEARIAAVSQMKREEHA